MAEGQGVRIGAGRAVLLLGLAALVSGAATIVLFWASTFLLPNVGPGVEAQGAISAGIVKTWLAMLVLAVLIWAAGLLIIGVPVWWLMHRLGLTRRFHALIAGALLAGIAGYVVGILAYAPYPVAWFIAFSLLGMLAAWVIWSRAYGASFTPSEASE